MSSLDKEIRRNIKAEIGNIVTSATYTLKQRFEQLLAEHAANDCLRSSGTMQETKKIIITGNKEIYQSIVNYLTSIEALIFPSLKSDILSAVATSLEIYRAEQLTILEKTERLVGGFPVDKIVLEIKDQETINSSKFQNQVTSLILKSKSREQISTALKIILWIVALLLTSSLVISVKWLVDPEGNYEPLIGILTAIAGFLIFIKEIVFSAKN